MNAEKIKELREFVKFGPAKIVAGATYVTVPSDSVTALLDEVEALTADAERYRWLRDKADNPDAVPFIARRNAYGISQWNGAQADAAIDAARHEPKDDCSLSDFEMDYTTDYRGHERHEPKDAE